MTGAIRAPKFKLVPPGTPRAWVVPVAHSLHSALYARAARTALARPLKGRKFWIDRSGCPAPKRSVLKSVREHWGTGFHPRLDAKIFPFNYISSIRAHHVLKIPATYPALTPLTPSYARRRRSSPQSPPHQHCLWRCGKRDSTCCAC